MTAQYGSDDLESYTKSFVIIVIIADKCCEKKRINEVWQKSQL